MSGSPRRLRLSRQKGYRKPEGAVVVARPSRWGNFYVVRRNRVPAQRHPLDFGGRFTTTGPKWVVVTVGKFGQETGSRWGAWDDKAEATTFAVELFRRTLEAIFVDLDGDLNREYYLKDLRGKDLACWCPLDGSPCHADVLLALANT